MNVNHEEEIKIQFYRSIIFIIGSKIAFVYLNLKKPLRKSLSFKPYSLSPTVYIPTVDWQCKRYYVPVLWNDRNMHTGHVNFRVTSAVAVPSYLCDLESSVQSC